MSEKPKNGILASFYLPFIPAMRTIYVMLAVGCFIIAIPFGLSALSAAYIAKQVVDQLKEQVGAKSYYVCGHNCTVKRVIMDSCQMSPDHNHIDIEYRIVWQPTVTTYTGMGLNKDQYGHWNSGNVSQHVGDASTGNAGWITYNITVE